MHTADTISFLTGGDGPEGNEGDRDSEDMQIEQIGELVTTMYNVHLLTLLLVNYSCCSQSSQ